ncbi:phosphotransferase family protein [Paracoccus sp. P2]|uniref:Phosphotransferase family enzyme n=2 Tax=Paracoccus TaxID=265 RepID=A0ABX9SEB2_PARPN|nr:phosphotransferase [Paracoccus pantotrophus]MDF3854906.1 phosphotransferase [Paracoccus pantotrophus]RKS52099.1 phosphotransferase family enzyme [Paracoccus pantotrophus]SFO54422.1 Phosphotransferase enzyme family protein [Paracoccus pantotrophus]
MVRNRPDRLVVQIRLDGRPAWLRQFRGADPPAGVARAQARLRQAAEVLGQDLDAVAPPLLALPEQGILITAPAPGRPVAHLLAEAGPAERAALIARMGSWLRRLASATRNRGTFGPRFWLNGLEARIAAASGDWIDRDLVAGHMQRMRAEAARLRGAAVERGLCHGDLTPDNLFVDEPRPGALRLTAIDMQGATEMALARDMARLLAWLESRREQPPALVRDGIALPDWQALTGVPGLLAPDQAPILRFLIGEVMLAYYLDSARQRLRRRALVRAMRAWAKAEVTPAP